APNRPCSPRSSDPASISLVSAAPTYCHSSANPLPPPYPDNSPVCPLPPPPIPTTRPSAPSRRHQTRPRHLSLLSHPRWPRRHRCRPPPHRTHHHSCSGLTNLLTKCKHSGRKRLRFFADRAAKKWPLRGSLKYAGVLLAYPP